MTFLRIDSAGLGRGHLILRIIHVQGTEVGSDAGGLLLVFAPLKNGNRRQEGGDEGYYYVFCHG